MTDHAFTPNPAYVDLTRPSRLTHRIFLAGAAGAREHQALHELGITAVVNLTPDDFGCAEAGFKVHHVPIDDAVAIASTHVRAFLEVMDAWDAAGEVVLIHCHAGISRTAAFAIAWLMHQASERRDADLLLAWDIAEAQVRMARPIIMPHYLLKRAVLAHFNSLPVPDAGGHS